MLIEMLKRVYREINMQWFCAQCIWSWASRDKTLQSYSPDNSLFHTFAVTDDDACVLDALYTPPMCIYRYKQVLVLIIRYPQVVPSTQQWPKVSANVHKWR